MYYPTTCTSICQKLGHHGGHRKETLAGGPENGPLRLCSGRVWDHPSSRKNQGKLRTNQPQLTPAQGYERKRKFRELRFVSDNQAVLCDESGHTKFPFSCLAHVTMITDSGKNHFRKAALAASTINLNSSQMSP